MKVLTVCREIPQNFTIHRHSIAEFIFEQNKALERYEVEYDYYLIKNSGFIGYIKEIKKFHLFLKEKKLKYSIIHAHGGHVGLLANSQRKIPVVTTYHGSDINNKITRLISIAAIILSAINIFVSKKIFDKVKRITKNIVIPCGVDFSNFQPLDKIKCRNKLGLSDNKKIVLFAGRKERKEKNYSLAAEASAIAGVENLIELKNYSREEVNLLLNACDILLLTSVSEGSPQVIKEAMACNCPIVATDVGDVKQIISTTEGCYITSSDPSAVAENIKKALRFNKKTNGRDSIKYLDNQLIADQIAGLYKKAIKNKQGK